MQKKYDIKEIQKLCSDYCNIGQILGQGSFGVVFKATLKTKRKSIVALKCINKNMFLNQSENFDLAEEKSQLIDEEVNIMTNCNNINLLKCLNTVEDEKYRILFLKYCEGGDLYHKILKQKKIKQSEAIKILAQILIGFASLHKMKVIHRDFKTDNIIIRKGVYKIADFGTAKKIQHLLKSSRGTVIGSRITMSPQVIQGKQYGIQSDMWSLGIVYFQMIFGKLPFMYVINDIQIKKLWSFLQVQNCSIQSKNLLKRILVINPNQRLKWIQLYKLYNNRQQIFSQRMFNPNQIKTQQSEDELDDLYLLKYGQNNDFEYLKSNTTQNYDKQIIDENRNYQEQCLQDYDLYQYEEETNQYQQYQWTQQDQQDQQYFLRTYNKFLKKGKKFKDKYKLKYEQSQQQTNKHIDNEYKKQYRQIQRSQFKQIQQIKFTRLRALLLHNIIILSQIDMNKFQLIEKLNVLKLQILINEDARKILYSKRQFIDMEYNINNYQKKWNEILKYKQAARILILQRNNLIDKYQSTLFQYQRKRKNKQKMQQQRQRRIQHQDAYLHYYFDYRYMFSNYMFYSQGKRWSSQIKPLYFFQDHLLRQLKIKFSNQMIRQMKHYVRIVKFHGQQRDMKMIRQQAQKINVK